MIREIKNFNRKELFEYYNAADNPFLYITTNIDVTKVVKFTKRNKVSFYATIGFLINKAVDDVENFKFRFEKGKYYYCDVVKSNYTQKAAGNKIGFFSIPSVDNFVEYINYYKEKCAELEGGIKQTEIEIDDIWFSCVPWFKFSGVISPFRKSVTIPQFIWDKFEKTKGKFRMNLTVMAHHGFVDGQHFAALFEKIQANINKVDLLCKI